MCKDRGEAAAGNADVAAWVHKCACIRSPAAGAAAGKMGAVRGGDGGSARGSEDTALGADASIAATIQAVKAETLSSGVWKPETAELPRGTEVGRYVVLGQLGAGGMGVVYAAYDPELDRKVALKLVREEATRAPETSDGRTRLLREAQALARLNHPNVVAVHDVGTFADRVYLAMEHVEGLTLRSWVQAGRAWPELLRVLVAAGRGLAAGHAAGLVHRDVKPDNIMIGVDGRVRVMDFGLARATGTRVAAPPVELPAQSERLSLSVTRTGSVMGTPAYMAPEQWAGKEADARSDQFAYGVMVWEALFGERPFAGETLSVLAPKVLRGEVRSPPQGHGAPGWLRRAVMRALAAEPGQRWPDMARMLAALERGRGRARRAWISAGCVALVVAGAGALGWRQHVQGERAAACVAAGAEIDAVWDDAARTRLAAGLLGSGAAHADATYARVVPWIDRWTGEWARLRSDVCVEATIEGTRAPGELVAATGCLAEQREALEELLVVLGEGDRFGVTRAVPAVAALPAVATCGDPEVLARWPAMPDDEATRAEVQALRRELGRVRGLRYAGRRADGGRRAAGVVAAADRLGYRPLTIQARLAYGGAVAAADPASAEEALTRAFMDAGELGADELAAAAATELVGVVGSAGGRPAEGLVWGRSAAMFVARLGRTGTLAAADVDDALAAVHTLRGAYDEAQRLFARALAVREAELGPDHPRVAGVLVNLAAVHRARGERAEARALLERALASEERVFGADSPLVAGVLVNLAALRREEAAYDEAQALLERALPIQEAALGPEHPELGATLGNLGSLLLDRGESARATPVLARSLEVQRQALGPDHPDVAVALYNLALVHGRLGEHAEAVALHEQALAIREAALGPDSREVLASLEALGFERFVADELAAAAGLYARALALRERALPADDVDLAWSLETNAELRLAQGRLDEVEPLLARARGIRGKVQPPGHHALASNHVWQARLLLARGGAKEAIVLLEPALATLTADAAAPAIAVADAEFALAQALGAREARARALAQAAAGRYAGAGRAGERPLRSVRAWLGQ